MATLIAELMALQARTGWLRDSDLVELAARLRVPLHRLESLTTFYPHFHRAPPKPRRVGVCRDLACRLAGGSQALQALRAELSGRSDVEIVEISCPGRCDQAPAALIGDEPFCTREPGAPRIAVGDRAPSPDPESVRGAWAPADPYERVEEHYGTLRDARSRDPDELPGRVEASGLRGMGGAAFSTGRKWSLVAASPSTPRYVICNADESEPGTFKDREILHDLPHLVIEGMALAAHAVGAEQGFVFIRHEYEAERRRLERALERARGMGALGPDANGEGRPFDIEVFVSPGGYILGEETALLECMEDRRGEPRNKPPFPGQAGLYGQPTLINNVETFAHATAILARGSDWWSGLGVRGHAGHKFISVCGDVARPGVELVPFGTTFGELLERCGGMQDGRALSVFAPGGASSRFLGPEALEVEIGFESVAAAGSMLGSGAVVYVAEGHDWREVGLSITRFFRNESCGKCVPCRVGTEKAVALVEQTRDWSPDLSRQLEELDRTLARTSLCGLGQVALGPLLSLADRFAERPGDLE